MFDWSSVAETNTSTLQSSGTTTTVGLATGNLTSALSLNQYGTKVNGVAGLREHLDTGKTVVFTGESGTLNLKNSINQGAGALYFNNNFTVTSDNATDTWLGAGVSIADGKTVDWQVHNPENDRLSKIGQGTLFVNGTGINQGDISVGDGRVVLAQKADGNGDVQAFNEVGIVSGRGTVVLTDDKQVKADNIYFGYRGGRLDVNGNDLTFSRIQNVDDGARIVNHNITKEANITIKGQQALTPYENTGVLMASGGILGVIIMRWATRKVLNWQDAIALIGVIWVRQPAPLALRYATY